jgi:hypothetical protein
MAKPVELVTTLYDEDADNLLKAIEHPPKNKAWERTVAKAKKIKIE